MKSVLAAVLCCPILFSAPNQVDARKQFLNLPLAFEANAGQAGAGVEFLTRGDGFTALLQSGGAVLIRRNQQARMRLIGFKPGSSAQPLERQAGVSNYLMGRDPKAWRSDVARYGKVRWNNVYPGIDIVYYGNQRKLEYDFVVNAGADPSRIELAWDGVDSLKIDSAGDLLIAMAGDELRMHRPRVYQRQGNVEREVAASYRLLKDRHVTLDLAGYDTESALVIDPVLSFSSYFGGSNNDLILGIATDSANNVYLCGRTDSTNIPVSGALPAQTFFHGGFYDAFVAKLNASGTALVYATYLGGSGDEACNAIAVDATGAAYIAGFTNSASFPLASPLQSQVKGGTDAFVAKLAPDGHSLVYSTFLGGAGSDIAYSLALDSSQSVYVVGSTTSTDFPVVAGSYRVFKSGSDHDGFAVKINPSGNALIYATYYGGSSTDEPGSASVDGAGNLYVTGSTRSTDFPVTANAILFSAGGGTLEGFYLKLNAAGSVLLYSSYIGGSGADRPISGAVDEAGHFYITGATASPNFPVTPNAIQSSLQITGVNDNNPFLTKVNSQGNAVIYSTLFGGTGSGSGEAIKVNPAGYAFVSADSYSSTIQLAGGPFQSVKQGNFSPFLMVFAPTGGSLAYSTYLNGAGGDGSSAALTLDSDSNLYVAGYTSSSAFPATTYQTSYGGGVNDGYVTKFSGFNLPAPCLGTLGASSLTLSSASVPLSIPVNSSCSWNAFASSNFLNVTAGATGSGSGTVNYLISANTLSTPRMGSISVAGNILQILQKGTGATAPFDDVTQSHPLVDYIQLMKANGITSGCTTTTYCPDNTTTRGQMAVFIIRAMLGGDNFPFPSTPYFTDVPAIHPQFRWIQKMKELGITSGCTTTTYCPDAAVTRGQMAVFVVRGLLGNTFSYSNSPYFTDVPFGNAFFPYVQKMKEWGITTGCNASSYCPDDNTTRGQMAVFVMRGYFSPR